MRAEKRVSELLMSRDMSPEDHARAMRPYVYDSSTPLERIEEDLAIRRQWFPKPDAYAAQLQGIFAWEAYSRLQKITAPTLGDPWRDRSTGSSGQRRVDCRADHRGATGKAAACQPHLYHRSAGGLTQSRSWVFWAATRPELAAIIGPVPVLWATQTMPRPGYSGRAKKQPLPRVRVIRCPAWNLGRQCTRLPRRLDPAAATVAAPCSRIFSGKCAAFSPIAFT